MRVTLLAIPGQPIRRAITGSEINAFSHKFN